MSSAVCPGRAPIPSQFRNRIVNRNPENSSNVPIEQPRKSTPLGAMFLLVAVCSVLIGMAVPGIQSIQNSALDWGQLLAFIIFGFGGGSLNGFLVGLFFEDRVASSLIGALVGSIAGLLAALMMCTEIEATSSVLVTSVIGSLAVLVCAFLVRQRGENERNREEM